MSTRKTNTKLQDQITIYIHNLILVGLLSITIHCLHDSAHKQDSQLYSTVLITVWRFVIENSVTGLTTKQFNF